jgi:hypothetical protein
LPFLILIGKQICGLTSVPQPPEESSLFRLHAAASLLRLGKFLCRVYPLLTRSNGISPLLRNRSLCQVKSFQDEELHIPSDGDNAGQEQYPRLAWISSHGIGSSSQLFARERRRATDPHVR